MSEFLLSRGWPLLAGVAVKSLCVVALAAVAALALRRASAAARHLVWRLALAGLLLLPLFSSLPAAWQVPLAPRAFLAAPDAPVVTPPAPVMGGGGDRPPAPNSGGVGAAPAPSPLAPPELGAGGRSGGQSSSLPWPVWACALWLIGFVLTLLPSLVGLAGVGRLARRSSPVPDGPLRGLAASLAPACGVARPVRLLLGKAGTPMTWGWRRPVVLLPVGADAWPEDRLRAVLLHELAHIARADWPAQMTSHLACALYWFNPAVWLAARQARVESERACDDRVLLAGVPAPDYARHLLDVARALRDAPLPAALPMVRPSQIESRLIDILHPKRRTAMLTRKSVTVAALATLAVIVPLASLRPAAQARPRHPAAVNALPAPAADAQSLPGGIQVRLVGVKDIAKTSTLRTRWWGLSGENLPHPALTLSRHTIGPYDSQSLLRAFAFHVTSPDGLPVTVIFGPKQSRCWSCDGSWFGKLAGQARATETQLDAATGGCRLLYAAYSVRLAQDDIRVGVGAGPWKTAASDVSFTYGSISGFSAGTYAFSPLTKTADGSVVTISVSVDEDPQRHSTDLRVVALDRAGHEHLPVDIGDNSSGMLDQIQARFALPPSAIKSVRLETRPLHWVTFRNVPLRPRA